MPVHSDIFSITTTTSAPCDDDGSRATIPVPPTHQAVAHRQSVVCCSKIGRGRLSICVCHVFKDVFATSLIAIAMIAILHRWELWWPCLPPPSSTSLRQNHTGHKPSAYSPRESSVAWGGNCHYVGSPLQLRARRRRKVTIEADCKPAEGPGDPSVAVLALSAFAWPTNGFCVTLHLVWSFR